METFPVALALLLGFLALFQTVTLIGAVFYFAKTTWEAQRREAEANTRAMAVLCSPQQAFNLKTVADPTPLMPVAAQANGHSRMPAYDPDGEMVQ